MDEKEFIELVSKPEINRNAIASSMYPANNFAKTKLANKIAKTQGKTGTQRLTDEDLKKGEEVLRKLADDIYSKLSASPVVQDQPAE